MSETKRKLFVEPDGFCTEASMLLMALAIVFRLIGSIGRWGDMSYLITQLALPCFGGLLFLLFLLLFSRRAFWTTVIPVLIGIVYFIFCAMELDNKWMMIGSIVVYMVIVVLYAMCFSHKNLKWVLVIIFLLLFAYHVGLKDLPVLMDLENPVSFVDGMQEMSLLAVLLAMFFVCLAMKVAEVPDRKKRKAEPAPEETQPAAEPVPEQIPVPEPEPVPAPETADATEIGPAQESGQE